MNSQENVSSQNRRKAAIFLHRVKSKRLTKSRKDDLREKFHRQQRKQRLAFVFVLCLMFNILISRQNETRERLIWCKERSKHFWNWTVKYVFKTNDWCENFRMRKETFEFLCNRLRNYITKQCTNMSQPISVEERVAVTLWYLSAGSGFRTVAWLFGISKSSVCTIVRETCDAIVQVLQKQMIKLPKGDMLDRVIEGFEFKWGFPNCVGAVDGTHIPVTPPSNCRTDYYNRKGSYSIILQGLVDFKYLFTDIYVGWPGKVHDARVFRNSSIYTKGCQGTLFPPRPRNINGTDVPLVILGDPAYPLLPWLMKPFPDNGRLNDGQKTFNYRQSRARMVIENAFGRLKGRWRVLLKKMEVSIDIAPIITSACCVLHNLCEIWGEEFQDEWLAGVNENVANNVHLRLDRDNSAKRIRDAFVAHFQAENN